MTSLSEGDIRRAWTIAELPTLARLSLCLIVSMLFGVPTCLVTSTVDFPPSTLSTPYLDPNTALATPVGGIGVPITKIVVLDRKADVKQLTLSAEVQSEDNGQRLYYRAFVNYKAVCSVPSCIGPGNQLEPGTFDDVRKISVDLNTDKLPPGCYQVALVASHLFDFSTFQPVHQEDTAFLVWWLLVGDTPAGSVKMTDCPGGPPSPPSDAGIEASDATGM